MSCNGKGYGTKVRSDDYLNSQFFSINGGFSLTNLQTRCVKKSFYPSFKPIISGLSNNSAEAGTYNELYITGFNFLPNGTTYLMFGNIKCDISYSGSNNISFIIPFDADVGVYNVIVVNIYNDNFSPAIRQTRPGQLIYSNIVKFTLF